MIPKIIHYCWFGRNSKSEKIQYCMDSWKKYLPDYQIIEWNEDNFDINKCSYVKDAYEQKKWAFVTDYVRAHALYNYGGIYLDTDVEITSNLDVFLTHGAFSGFESKGYPFTALWGSQKGHHWPKKVLDFYKQIKFNEETNTVYVSKILETEYGIKTHDDNYQSYNEDIFIYPSNYFCLNLRNYAIHHFEGSWVPSHIKNDVNANLRNLFIIDKFTRERSVNQCLDIITKEYKISNYTLLKIILNRLFVLK
jgi:mannosyltransferase OCH1-like enzyme